MSTSTEPMPDYLATLEQVIAEAVAPAAAEIDQTGAFPRAAIDALGQAGLLGLISAKEVGGMGLAQRHDLLGGKHGDHVGGELDGLRSLLAGTADAACLIKGNYETWLADGMIPSGATRVLAETAAYDHCNVTVGPAAPAALVERFHRLLMAMSYDDPEVRPLMELEGLTAWREGRVEGYRPLEAAVDAAGFYDRCGAITESEYGY